MDTMCEGAPVPAIQVLASVEPSSAEQKEGLIRFICRRVLLICGRLKAIHA